MRVVHTVILCFLQVYIVLCGLSRYHEAIGIPKAYMVRGLERISRVIGGSPVSVLEKNPYQTAIICSLTTGKTSLCGGALISDRRVLTAAHCWDDGQHHTYQFTVVLGSLTVFSGGTRITTSDVIVHPNWNIHDIVNDIAIVKLPFVMMAGGNMPRLRKNVCKADEPLYHFVYKMQLSAMIPDNVQAISLPMVSDIRETFAGFYATATGYGKISDSQSSSHTTTTLHFIKLKILKNVICQDSFTVKLHSSHLCTNGERGVGTCDGDSGGPLTVMWRNKRILVGIVSFGFGDGCSAGYPSVYTRVTSFIMWIQQHI